MKKKILIIDNDVVTLKVLKKYLRDDYDVTIEGSAYKFVEAIDSGPYALYPLYFDGL